MLLNIIRFTNQATMTSKISQARLVHQLKNEQVYVTVDLLFIAYQRFVGYLMTNPFL